MTHDRRRSLAYWTYLIFPLFLIALLFPNGRPVARPWRWAVALAVAMPALFLIMTLFAKETTPLENVGVNATGMVRNPIGVISFSQLTAMFNSPFWSIGLAGLAVLSLAAPVVRYRRAGAVERHQIKWVMFACVLFALGYLPSVLTSGEGTGVIRLVLEVMLPVGVVAIPVSIGIAILRYRLFDIDVIIRRTLVYGALTAALALLFFGSVFALQRVFVQLTGQQSEIALVASTLLIAALALPLRHRIQGVIDRRFYRRKYDAQKTLEAFAARLQSQSETDVNGLAADVTRAIQETLQPSQVKVWLVEQSPESTRRSDAATQQNLPRHP